MMQLGNELGQTSDDDPLLLILAWKSFACVIWELSRQEWLRVWSLNGCFSLEQMKDMIQMWKDEIANYPEEFRSFYTFIFDYIIDERSTAVDKNEAVLCWTMIGLPRRWSFWEHWLRFLQEKQIKSITKDVWVMLLKFIEQIGNDISLFDPFDCWPLTFDEFSEFITNSK